MIRLTAWFQVCLEDSNHCPNVRQGMSSRAWPLDFCDSRVSKAAWRN